MGGFNGNYSRNPNSAPLFDEKRLTAYALLQGSVPLIDADWNDSFGAVYRALRRVIQNALGDGAPGDAFKVVEHRNIGGALVENSFKLVGDFVAGKGPSIFFLGGHAAKLFEEVVWNESGDVSPVSSGVSGNILSDSAAFYETDELVGRELVPDINQPAKKFTIIANTQSSITVSVGIDLVAEGIPAKQPYKVLTDTPVSTREDVVYLDVYLDEIDATEDPELLHTFGTTFEAMRRAKLVQSIHVRQGTTTLPTSLQQADGKWLDSDGNEHFLIPIACITRTAGSGEIPDSSIEDKRRILFALDAVDEKFINAVGDTMQGNLTFDTGAMILGNEVVGGDAIKTEAIQQRHFDRTEHLLGDGGEVPSASNLPIVHDNRYFTKSLILGSFGENLLCNGDLRDCLKGWENLSPAPLWGAPGEEALEKSKVICKACGDGCCRSIATILQPDFGGCDITLVSQEIDVCGGGFFAFQVTMQVNTQNQDVKIKPFVTVSEYASHQLQGTKKVTFQQFSFINEPPNPGEQPVLQDVLIGAEDSVQRFTVFFQLSPQTDKVTIYPSIEVVFPCCNVEEEVEILLCDLVFKKFATQGSIVDGQYQTGVFTGIPENEALALAGQVVSPVAARADIALGKALLTPTVIEVASDGKVTLRPGAGEKNLLMYKRPFNPEPVLFKWKPSTNESDNPTLLQTFARNFGSWFETAIGLSSDEMEISFLIPGDLKVDDGIVEVQFFGRNIPPASLLQITANPANDIAFSNVSVDGSGLFGTFDVSVGTAASLGVNTFRFTRTSDGTFEDVSVVIGAKESPAPIIYSIDKNVLAGAAPVQFTLRGKNFIQGQTSVSSLDSNLAVVVGSVTESEIQITVTKGAGFTVPPSKSVQINVSTPFGFDSFEIWVVDTKVEKVSAGVTFEGAVFPGASGGFGGTLSEIFLSFENGETFLDIVGGNLQSVISVRMYSARIDGRARGSLGGLKISLIDVADVVLATNFAIHHATGIRINLSTMIYNAENTPKTPFAIQVQDSGGTSATFVIEQRDQINLTSANFYDTGFGPQLLGGVLEANGTFFHNGIIVLFSRTVVDIGVQAHMIRPSSVGSPNDAMVPTEQPVDVLQAMTARAFAPPYGLTIGDLGGFNIQKAGTFDVLFGVSPQINVTAQPQTMVVDNIAPGQIEQGQQTSFLITGVGFRSGAAVQVDPPAKFTVDNVVVQGNGTLITCRIEAAADAALGPHDVTVVNPDSTNAVKVGGLEVVIPEAAIGIFLDASEGLPSAPAMRIALEPDVDAASVIEGKPVVFTGGKDLAPVLANNGDIRFQIKWDGLIDATLTFVLVDLDGNKKSKNLGLLSQFPVAAFQAVDVPLQTLVGGVFNWGAVGAVQFSFVPVASPGVSNVIIDTIETNVVSQPSLNFLIDDFGIYADQTAFEQKWEDAGANHVVAVGFPISCEVVPIVNMPSDELENFSFLGDPADKDADVVLVPCTDENIQAGGEFPWTEAGASRVIQLSKVNYRNAPAKCCKNIFVETMHMIKSGCRGVEAVERTYLLPNNQCDCAPPSSVTQVVGDMVTDPLMYRMLPDDGFNGLPTNFGESFELRYCQNLNPPFVNECGYVSLGSKSTPLQVLYSGGGRNDPNVFPTTPVNPSTNDPIFVRVNMGPGSPQATREALLAIDLLPGVGSTQVEVTFASIGNNGFAVGQTVWIFNYKDPRTGGKLRLTPMDVIENSDDPKLTGIYGTISAIDSDDFKMIVDLVEPVPEGAQYRTEWAGSIMVSPLNAMGFYWEASQGLVQLVSGQSGIVAQWSFNMWSAPALGAFTGLASANAVQSGVLLADGDGESTEYEFTQPTGKILRERDWLALWNSPIRAQFLLQDALPGHTFIKVCSPTRFNEGDVIVIQDDTFKPGFKTTIESVDGVLERLILRDPIPTSLDGFASFDGFLIGRSAKTFRSVTRVNKMACITTNANEDGTPADGQGHVVINHEAGTFTFDENDSGRARIFYASEQEQVQLPSDEAALISFRSTNKARVESQWSQIILVEDSAPGGS